MSKVVNDTFYNGVDVDNPPSTFFGFYFLPSQFPNIEIRLPGTVRSMMQLIK